MRFKSLAVTVRINSYTGGPVCGELFERVDTKAILPQYFARLDNTDMVDLRNHNYCVVEN